VPPPGAQGLVTLGGRPLALWQSRLRLVGLVPIALGLGLWSLPAERPALLVGPGARLVGVMGPEGRVVGHPRAQGFVAETWLRRDADPADQAQAAARPGLARVPGGLSAALPHGWRLVLRHRRGVEAAALAPLCRARTILLARHGPPPAALSAHTVDPPGLPCVYLGAEAISRLGALAARPGPSGPGLVAAAQTCRPWTGCPRHDP